MNYSTHLNGRVYADIFSPEECHKIINEAVITSTDTGRTGLSGQENNSYRKTKVSFLDHQEPANKWFCHRILAVALKANREYFKFDIADASGFQLLEYAENGHYDWHVDIGVHPPEALRKLSLVTFLSDPQTFSGGRLIWLNPDRPDGGIITQKQGTTVIFPAFQSHKVEPVTGGKRFALVGWMIGYTSFR